LKCEICGGFYDAVAIDPGADSGSSDTGDLQFLFVARATEITVMRRSSAFATSYP
jgi:hypothetical protein